jgi:flagellin
MQVLNNAPAFSVWKSYTSNVKNLRSSMSRLSSGMKIETAADDPAGLAISERMRSQARNSASAAQNIENAMSYAQTADSWMQKLHDIMGRMGELAVSANDGTKSSTDLAQLDKEYQQMGAEVTRIQGAAKYNGTAIFGGSALSVQIGPDNGQTFSISAIDMAGATGTAVGNNITDAASAATAITNTGAAIDSISGLRATLGSQSARMKHTLEGVRTYEANIRSAESQVRDVDMAKEATDFSKYQILSQVGTAMLAQANSLPQGVLRLIQ